jgi:phosphate transport system substrate-binding protein
MARTNFPKRKYGQRSAMQTGLIAGVVIAIIAIIGAGAYVALYAKTTTSTVVTTVTGPPGSTVTVTSTATPTTVTSMTSTTSAFPTSLPSETISETGSSLLYPLFNDWAPNFTALYSTVKINPVSSGSGTGQSSAETGVVQIGASDAYLSNATAAEYPYILNIPLAISAQQVNYNLPSGMLPAGTNLNFSGPVLAGIYNGTITMWNDPAIKAINPSVASDLPAHVIIPIHRADSSGDTFIFTQYLSKSSPSWNKSVGYGTTVSWPTVPAATAATGNGGMVTACEANQYSIAYIGISYLDEAVSGGLGYAFLENQAGNFVNITATNIQSAANVMVPQTPADERLSLIFAPGTNSYPIINYEYALVSMNQNATGMALTLRTFLSWAISPQYGSAPYYLDKVHFIPLPSSIFQLSTNQINEITGP